MSRATVSDVCIFDYSHLRCGRIILQWSLLTFLIPMNDAAGLNELRSRSGGCRRSGIQSIQQSVFAPGEISYTGETANWEVCGIVYAHYIKDCWLWGLPMDLP